MNSEIVLYAVAELVLALLVAISNFLVLWVFISRSPVRTPTNTFIFSLALTDFLAGAVGIPITVFSVLTRAPHSFDPCLFVHLILCILCTVSTFHLLVIAIDKYLTICCRCQLWLDQKARHRRARWLIIMAWVAGTLIGVLPMFDLFQFASRNRQRFRGECHFTLVVDYRYLVYVIFFGTIIIPSSVILCCYMAIYKRIGYEEQQIKCLLRASERRRRMRNRRKLIRTLLLLVCTYALCWFPLYLLNTFDLFFPNQQSKPILTLFSVVLSHANCALNPLIYAYGMPGYKHTLRRFVGIRGSTIKSPLMRNLSQLPLPTGKVLNGTSLTVHQHNAAIDSTRNSRKKKYSWTNIGRSMDSFDIFLPPSQNNSQRRHLQPVNESQNSVS